MCPLFTVHLPILKKIENIFALLFTVCRFLHAHTCKNPPQEFPVARQNGPKSPNSLPLIYYMLQNVCREKAAELPLIHPSRLTENLRIKNPLFTGFR
jgi:hypothetical protein